MTVILASTSATRRSILRNAGVAFEAVAPDFDEDTFKSSHLGLTPPEMAEALAEGKARSVSRAMPAALVLGADQVLNCAGARYGKARSIAEACEQLRRLRGQTHYLETALCCVRNGAVIWRHLARPELHMREFSDDFLDQYLTGLGEAVLSSTGSYQLESRGVQLFERIAGDYFAILGLPLLPLLEFLRGEGAIPS